MLSSRATYALHCVAFLARRYPDSPVTLQEITEGVSGDPENARLSDGYVAKALANLCRAGIIRGHVGRSGGYSLARRPCDVRVLDVVQALDGMQTDECCLRTAGRGCGNEEGCAVRKMIRRAEATFLSSLAGQSLAAMARNMVFGNGSNGANGKRRANGKKRTRKATHAARRSNHRKSGAP
jgi:Rrf2 family protein